jgi:hypothetical protein
LELREATGRAEEILFFVVLRLVASVCRIYIHAANGVYSFVARNSSSNPELLWLQAAAELRSAWTDECVRPNTGNSRLGGSQTVLDTHIR